ncbi:hypothetical protein BJX66DRAFT_330336 [Aspergillus keveii]|uniref:RapZ C-terminal domain-containing protein n=1 Tax=Aspergillus keveii TaxID=714993 RepID=A0ABR4FKY4_9EURO
MDPLPTYSGRTVKISLFSYGHSNGPIVQQQQQPNKSRYHKTLAYNIRHLPNPPRHLRANGATGLSRRLQKEFLQNDSVEAYLAKVQGDIADAIREEWCARVVGAHEPEPDAERNEQSFEQGGPRADVASGEDDAFKEKEGDIDIDLVVTICCEEGRHRSVAFVEELARRLATLKDGYDNSQYWELDIHVTHREIQGHDEISEQSPDQRKGPSKAQAKSRQKERREKGKRYKSGLESDDNLDYV